MRELVRYYMDIEMKGAWTGPASLQLAPHALAPVADLPVLEMVEAPHLGADLTLGLGEVVYELSREVARFASINERTTI